MVVVMSGCDCEWFCLLVVVGVVVVAVEAVVAVWVDKKIEDR